MGEVNSIINLQMLEENLVERTFVLGITEVNACMVTDASASIDVEFAINSVMGLIIAGKFSMDPEVMQIDMINMMTRRGLERMIIKVVVVVRGFPHTKALSGKRGGG